MALVDITTQKMKHIKKCKHWLLNYSGNNVACK